MMSEKPLFSDIVSVDFVRDGVYRRHSAKVCPRCNVMAGRPELPAANSIKALLPLYSLHNTL
jgi:hypothetical protein